MAHDHDRDSIDLTIQEEPGEPDTAIRVVSPIQFFGPDDNVFGELDLRPKIVHIDIDENPNPLNPDTAKDAFAHLIPSAPGGDLLAEATPPPGPDEKETPFPPA